MESDRSEEIDGKEMDRRSLIFHSERFLDVIGLDKEHLQQSRLVKGNEPGPFKESRIE